MLRRTALPALLLALCAAVPADAAAPSCRTPDVPHEPPCNPHLADSAWAGSHRSSYASGSSALPAPQPGDAVTRQRIRLPGPATQVPISIAFSSPYPDGARAAWMSVVSSPDVEGVHKVDAQTGEVLGSVTVAPRSQEATITGAYNLLDRDDHLFVGRQRALEVFGDARPGERRSPIAKLASLTIPDGVLCGPADKLVGITMTYDGMVAFASERGAVGVVPRQLDRLRSGELQAVQLNAGRCGEPDDALEVVSNSISADEDGGIYVVTSKRMHRIQWDGRELRRAWSAAYETGEGGGVRLGDGSGSTPDVMGTSRDRDRFVVITDGRPLMHLVLLWRDAIPAGWKPIAPGKDPRIACEVPVRFGDPAATASSSEQSVLTSGFASFVVNNRLGNEAVLALLPDAQRRVVAALAGQDPLNAPYGMERIDWDPGTRTCRSVWANREVSIPNAIPTLSTASGLVYGQGQRLGAWGLEGLDLATGRSTLRVEASASPESNSIYAATEVGPDGDVWQGAAGGIDVYRGPERPGPALTCFDVEAPVLGRLRAARRGTRVRVTAAARDTACGAASPVVRVRLVVARRVADGCRVVAASGRLGARRSCAGLVPAARRGEVRRGTFRATTRALRAGRYVVRAVAVDAEGRRSAVRGATVRVR